MRFVRLARLGSGSLLFFPLTVLDAGNVPGTFMPDWNLTQEPVGYEAANDQQYRDQNPIFFHSVNPLTLMNGLGLDDNLQCCRFAPQHHIDY